MNSTERSQKLANTAHTLTIVDPHESVVTDFKSTLHEQKPHQDFAEVGKNVSQLTQLISELPARFFAGDLKKYAFACGFSQKAVELLLRFKEPIRTHVFARGDLIKNNSGWKLLEVNAGSTVGGIFYASLTRLSGFQQKHDVLRLWAEMTIKSWGVNGPIALVEDSENLEYMKLSLHVMAKELSLFCQQPVYILGHKDLHWDGKVMRGPEGPISYVSNLFNEIDVAKNPESYEPLFQAIQNESVKMVMGPIYRLIANKGALALLYQLRKESKLTKEESDLVSSFVPETYFVHSMDRTILETQKNEWLLKPIDGFAGKGIYCGKDLSAEDWKINLNKIIEQLEPNSYVAQRYIAPSIGMTELTNSQGDIIERNSQILWGVFVFGTTYLGSFIRAKPDQGSSVINHANGASVGPFPEQHSNE